MTEASRLVAGHRHALKLCFPIIPRSQIKRNVRASGLCDLQHRLGRQVMRLNFKATTRNFRHFRESN
jgi:hypothetical protein